MQNQSKSDYTERKRNSSAGLENNPPNKMGKQNKNNNFRKRSAANILMDIKYLKQKRKVNGVEATSEGHVTWHTVSTICPATDPAIPQEALERFVNFLTGQRNPEMLDFWKRQYEEVMAHETVQMIDDCEKLALCPVCQEELPKSQIEAHADECAAKMFQN